MKKLFSILLLTAFFALLFWSCEKKTNPPALPPTQSMSIDFSNFTSGKKSVEIDLQNKGLSTVSNINWASAAITAGVWNTILAITLAVPVASFNQAVNTTPVYLENSKWEWTYNVNTVGATYKARLTGQIRSTDVKWEMYVSKEGVGAFAEFLWFSGTSAPDRKSGQWILNHSPLFQEQVLQIDWTLTGTKIGSIKYTYVRDLKDNRTTDTFKNSYIEYGLTANSLDAFYNIHQNISGVVNDFKDVYIEWSTANHNGHIKAFHYFQDNNWHCWDGAGSDVTCN
jgi:hypothetical protein